MFAMEVNDDTGNLTPPRRPEVLREHARSYRVRVACSRITRRIMSIKA
jgi:hypothetical protein